MGQEVPLTLYIYVRGETMCAKIVLNRRTVSIKCSILNEH